MYQPEMQPGQQIQGGQPGPGGGPPMMTVPYYVPQLPQGLSNCPPGLEYLSMLDLLLVHQQVELLEVLIDMEMENKYTVKNSQGQMVYFAAEDSHCCIRKCCGAYRPFDMKIYDNFRNEVIHMNRRLACDSCCCPWYLQRMEVSSPPGIVIGAIEQQWSFCKPEFVIKDAAGGVVLKIQGPFCTYSMFGRNVEFDVFRDGVCVGKISKQWSGLTREFLTDIDYFGISFPMQLDVRIKAVLLGACFLIDYMYYEDS